MKRLEVTQAPLFQGEIPGFDAGGPVAAMHGAIAAHMSQGMPSDWSGFSEPLSGMEAFIDAASRVTGVVALIGGVISVTMAVLHFF